MTRGLWALAGTRYPTSWSWMRRWVRAYSWHHGDAWMLRGRVLAWQWHIGFTKPMLTVRAAVLPPGVWVAGPAQCIYDPHAPCPQLRHLQVSPECRVPELPPDTAGRVSPGPVTAIWGCCTQIPHCREEPVMPGDSECVVLTAQWRRRV